MIGFEVLDLRAQGGGRTPRPKRSRTDLIVLHHFGVQPLTFDRVVAFFLGDPEGIATVTLSGSPSTRSTFVSAWRRYGVPENYAIRAHVPYHFCIDPHGRVAQFLDEEVRGAHAGAVNSRSVAVCLLGMFEKTPPTEPQIEALAGVLGGLLRVYPNARVVGHDDVRQAKKGCPGMALYLEVMNRWARLACGPDNL